MNSASFKTISIILGLFLPKVYAEIKLDYSDVKNSIVSNEKQLTFVGTRAGEGYYSQDGSKMVFQSEREPGNPFYQMYIADFETGTTQRISTGTGKTTCGWIHPDLKTVMWSSTHEDKKLNEKVKAELDDRNKPVKNKYAWSYDENFEIYTSNLKGQKVKRLTNVPGYDAEGAYSPDGKSIVFASNRSAYDKNAKLSADDRKKLQQDPSYFMEIYTMNANGTKVRRLTESSGYDGGPFFSADGKKITWRRFSPDSSRAEIYTMNADGSSQTQVTRLNVMSWAPFFHPSGDYIIFTTSALGYANFELFIVDTLGSKAPVRVSFNDGFDGLPTFSPNGLTLSWTRRNEKGESQIYMAEWNDAEARRSLGLETRKTNELVRLTSDINVEDSRAIVTYLASGAFKGRMTGSQEEVLYTNAFADLFRQWNLKTFAGNTFIQEFEFTSDVLKVGVNAATLKGKLTKNLTIDQDFQVVSYSKTGRFEPAPIVFAGFGILAPATPRFPGFDSYRNLDVKGKWVAVLDGQPRPEKRDLQKHADLVNYAGTQHKISVAKNHGAFGLILVEEKISPMRFEGSLYDASMPVIRISAAVFNELVKTQNLAQARDYDELRKTFDRYEWTAGFNIDSVSLAAEINLQSKKSTGRNVVGILNPSSKSGANEPAILIGAHGDHLGLGHNGNSLAVGEQKGAIHYGADDNASGVAGVLELAHYFSERTDRLTRPLIFAIWSGEEIGILGSSHFVRSWNESSRKAFDKSFFAAMNMDMIGQLGRAPQNQLFVQGVGSGKEWASVLESVSLSQKNGARLNMAAMQDPYLPTDAMAFYLGKIPSISFFTGAHDLYHTPNDRAETLNYHGLAQIIHVVKSFTEILETPSTRMTFEEVSGNRGAAGSGGRSFKIYLGTIPDYSQEGVKGVRISGASRSSPADKAGLKNGDVIIEFDKMPIENIYDYVYTLQMVKPGVQTTLKVLRKSKKIDLEITPVLKE